MRKKWSFEECLRHGKRFEQELQYWLETIGIKCKDTDLGKGIVPKYKGFVLPDRLCKYKEHYFWLEAKDKPRRVIYQDTGFEARLYKDYLHIQSLTGYPVLLVFKDTDLTYGNWLHYLTPSYINCQMGFLAMFHYRQFLPLDRKSLLSLLTTLPFGFGKPA